MLNCFFISVFQFDPNNADVRLGVRWVQSNSDRQCVPAGDQRPALHDVFLSWSGLGAKNVPVGVKPQLYLLRQKSLLRSF